MTKVLIAAPLRQKPEIFREYQKGLDNLIIPDGVTVDRYFVVNDCDEVIPEIRDAEYVNIHSDNVMVYQNHLWTGELVSNMSVYRNMTIRKALDGPTSPPSARPWISRHTTTMTGAARPMLS